jgi:anti-anti-sigma factor
MDQQRIGDAVTFRPRGTLDVHRLPDFDRQLRRALAEGARHVVWDLSEARLLPSSSIAFLIEAARATRAGGGRMVLAGASPHIVSTLAMMGVDKFFVLHPDVKTALRSLGEETPS